MKGFVLKYFVLSSFGAALVLSSLLTPGAALAQPASGAAPVAVTPASAVLISGPGGDVTVADFDLAVRDLVPPEQRASFWSQPEAVTAMAKSIYTQRALARQALSEGLDKTQQGQSYLQIARDRALTQLLMQHRVVQATPSETAQMAYVRSEYNAHPDKYSEPGQVHVRHILLRVAKNASDADDKAVKARIDGLRAELLKGADFSEMAKANSDDKANASKGGDMGFVNKGRMVEAFDVAAFKLNKPGEISQPVRTPFGYHLIQLVEKKAGRQIPMAEVEGGLREQLMQNVNATTRASVWKAAEAEAKLDEKALGALAERQTKP